MKIPRQLKEGSKVIGYFSYTNAGQVFCDGDACVIAGSSEAMKSYLERMPPNSDGRDMIKKTRFGEITNGLGQGGAYAFDEEAYSRFSRHAKNNGMEGLSTKEVFSEFSEAVPFIRIQMLG